jgi:hypothetical protein
MRRRRSEAENPASSDPLSIRADLTDGSIPNPPPVAAAVAASRTGCGGFEPSFEWCGWGCVCQSIVDEQACSRMRAHTGFRLGGFSIPPQSQSMELGRVGGQEPYRNRTSFFIALQNSVQLSPPDSSESRICSGKSRVGFQRDEGRGHEGD